LELLTALKSLTKLRSRLLGVVFDSSPLTRYESVNLYGRPCCSKRSGGAGTLARLTIFSQTARQTKNAARAAPSSALRMETHRLMRYCTAQFSRNEC
jgi:hypothetical protein